MILLLTVSHTCVRLYGERTNGHWTNFRFLLHRRICCSVATNRFGQTHLVRPVLRFRHQLKRNHLKATQAKRATAIGYAAQSAVLKRRVLDVSINTVCNLNYINISYYHSFEIHQTIKHLNIKVYLAADLNIPQHPKRI